MSNNIRLVLVQPWHPGNIGSVARAMKTMGLSELVLVKPWDYPHEEATRLAAGAVDVLESARVVETVKDAVAGCHLVVASTARPRGFDLPEICPDEMAELVHHQCDFGPVAVLFGPERFGLSNEDLQLARYRVTIPTSDAYSSLNLASAVQILSWALFRHRHRRAQTVSARQRKLPSDDEMGQFYVHLARALDHAEFINRQHPGKIMLKLKTLFGRSQPDEGELNILRGILAAVERLKRPE